MKRFLSKAQKYIFIVAFSLFIMGGLPLEYGEENVFFQGFQIEKPVIRIGLGVNLKDVTLSSSSGMDIVEVKNNFRLIADDVKEVYIKGHQEKLKERLWIQVGQEKDKEEADNLAQKLRFLTDRDVVVSMVEPGNISRGYRTKIGEFSTREEALDHINMLSEMSFADTWILREEIALGSKPLLLLFDKDPESLKEDTVLYFIPSHSQSYLSYNERNYKGVFILHASQKGLVLINLLNLEEYLKSVVPSELSPYTFPEIEAHKAQAVAARTYAIKNMGSFAELGFDLDDTPKTQYYKGMNAEHPLSSDAVNITRGEIALYNGTLIDALYTSTCGGMTENVENIFDGPALPYLRSTECVYEKQKEWMLKSTRTILPITINGRNVSGEIAFLLGQGVIDKTIDPIFYMEQVGMDEAFSWVQRAVVVLGRELKGQNVQPSPLTFLGFSKLVVEAFGWKEEVMNLFQQVEKDFILKNLKKIDDDRMNYIAYLIRVGVVPSVKEIRDPQRLLLRGELAFYLGRALKRFDATVHKGVFKYLQDGEAVLQAGMKERSLKISPDVFLLENDDKTPSFSKEISLIGGEQVSWIEKNEMIRYLEVLNPIRSNVLDRYSDYHSWRVRVSKSRLERRINKSYPIGRLIDVSPLRRGDSKRVVELLVKGIDASVIINGLRIRSALGVRDTLFVIDREYDGDSAITHYIFTGRGWGHGVGLCQVGAFGMAQAGADYLHILKKYYYGITIENTY